MRAHWHSYCSVYIPVSFVSIILGSSCTNICFGTYDYQVSSALFSPLVVAYCLVMDTISHFRLLSFVLFYLSFPIFKFLGIIISISQLWLKFQLQQVHSKVTMMPCVVFCYQPRVSGTHPTYQSLNPALHVWLCFVTLIRSIFQVFPSWPCGICKWFVIMLEEFSLVWRATLYTCSKNLL